MYPQLLSYTSLTIYYHLIFSLLIFHNGPITKLTQFQQNCRVPTKQHVSRTLLLPILTAPGVVSMKQCLLVIPFSHACLVPSIYCDLFNFNKPNAMEEPSRLKERSCWQQLAGDKQETQNLPARSRMNSRTHTNKSL